jgi:hypothetical protein
MEQSDGRLRFARWFGLPFVPLEGLDAPPNRHHIARSRAASSMQTAQCAGLRGGDPRAPRCHPRTRMEMRSDVSRIAFPFVPLEGLEPPTLSLGRNCSSIELQRLTQKVYRGCNRETQRGWRAAIVSAISVMRASGIPSS